MEGGTEKLFKVGSLCKVQSPSINQGRLHRGLASLLVALSYFIQPTFQNLLHSRYSNTTRRNHRDLLAHKSPVFRDEETVAQNI